MLPGHVPRTTTSPTEDTNAHADTKAAPRRSSGTSVICASSRPVFARSAPCHPDHRADKTPGMPFNASTASPESSATDGQPGCAKRVARLGQRVLLERRTRLRRLDRTGRRHPTTTRSGPRYPRRRAPAATRPASCGCGWPPAARSASERLLRRCVRLGQHAGIRLLQRLPLDDEQLVAGDERGVEQLVQR